MRCTQFIGLNSYARKWLEKPNFTCIGKEEITTGIGNEPIYGTVWQGELPWGMVEVKEVVDKVPWSSGPMIFTCLKVFKLQEEGPMEVGEYFRWMADPSLEDEGKEYDEETGRYFI